jgi:hypothetical protein
MSGTRTIVDYVSATRFGAATVVPEVECKEVFVFGMVVGIRKSVEYVSARLHHHIGAIDLTLFSGCVL